MAFMFCIGMAGCAAQQPIKQTASGQPEAFFEGKTPDEVSTIVALSCVQRGYVVEHAAGGNVKCTKQSTGGHNTALQLAFGVGSSGTWSVNVFCVQVEGGTRAYAQGVFEVQQSLGRKTTSPASFNEVQNWLDSLGGQ
jgi:hypothetical protein